MRIFVYTSLDKTLQSYLLEQVPPEAEVFFGDDGGAPQQVLFSSADILLGNPPTDWFDNTPGKLKFWQLDSAGFDQYQHINLRIAIANMGDFFAASCAETMIAGILALYRGLPQLIRLQDQRIWEGNKIRKTLDLLGNKNILILGTGSIGLTVKKMLQGFGCKIKTTARQNPLADFYTIEEVLAALPKSDLVINTLPGTADNYVTQPFFDAMREGSVYATVGRGNTTDEAALTTALLSGKLAGAVLDVTETEPLPADNVIWTMENVILTQHTGGGYGGERKGKVDRFIANLNQYLNNEDIDNRVDLRKGY